MTTSIDVDDALLREAQRVAGHAAKEKTVEQALRLMIRLRQQQEVDAAFGKIPPARQPRPKPDRAKKVIAVASLVGCGDRKLTAVTGDASSA